MSGKSLDINALDNAALEALLEQARLVQATRKDGNKAAYAESITDFVTQVVSKETVQTSDKSDWVGFGVRGLTVVVDGHAFTVSVTITDTAAKEARSQERAIEEARKLLAKAEAQV